MLKTWCAPMLILGSLITSSILASQDPPTTTIRTPELRRDAIVGVDIVPRPGELIEDGVILLADGVIIDVGSGLKVPEGFRIHERQGMVVYPGLIEPALLIESSTQATAVAAEHGAYPNSNIVPQLDLSTRTNPLEADGASLRGQGFCAALMLPGSRLIRGSGQVVLLDEEASRVRTPGGIRPQVIGLDSFGGWRSGGYPGSSMGVVALIRQTLADARWHAACRAVWEEHPEGNEPPVDARALDALQDVINGREPVVIDATNEIRALRGASIAEEFELDGIILGSGTEFRRAEEIAELNMPVLVPLAYPKKPEVTGARSGEGVDLRTLLTWKHAPENPRRLAEAGTDIAFTSHRLDDRGQFRTNLAKAIEAGLPEEAALTALTTTPARLLGLEDTLGTIEAGRIANLVVVDGNLFEPKDPVREVWIAGRRHSLNEKTVDLFPSKGRLSFGDITHEVKLDRNGRQFTVLAEVAAEEVAPEEVAPEGDEAQQPEPARPEEAARADATPETPKRKTWKGRNIKYTDRGVSGVLEGEVFAVEGPVRFDAVLLGGKLHGVGVAANGEDIRFHVIATEETEKDEEEPKVEEEAKTPEWVELASLPRPLGSFGRVTTPEEETVLFRNARIWTSADAGILEKADLLIRDGRIAAIGTALEGPEDARIVDLSGMQITPGLIDCHSHTGIDGGVNEGGQNNTAEVRIGDVLNPDDINWYRQLAGGLTAANQLHGSANPIGGQNAVVKLRWGADYSDMHLEGAKPGIKFALGENVVRPDNRYPDTRMGVAAFMEDAFRAGSEYQARHDEWNGLDETERLGLMPPRPDFELQTMAEIIAGDRLIHCHSYRQDEILALIRTADRWGITIGTLQHVLEGYKVAEAIAEHGAGASSFSDWWGYKMEVMDAIPYNGALMTKVGVLTSFNSDSNEVARRMNIEAAKAVRYGGIEPAEALKLVTINPAKQLRIDGRTGSIEIGKDADFVIWNGDPLSTYTRCQQTWIDGRQYYDVVDNDRLAAEVATERASLLASLVALEKKPESGEGEASPGAGGRGPGGRGGRRGWRGPPPVGEGRISTMARMLDAREDYLYELVRQGGNPNELRPGDCGCGDVVDAIEALRWENKR